MVREIHETKGGMAKKRQRGAPVPALGLHSIWAGLRPGRSSWALLWRVLSLGSLFCSSPNARPGTKRPVCLPVTFSRGKGYIDHSWSLEHSNPIWTNLFCYLLYSSFLLPSTLPASFHLSLPPSLRQTLKNLKIAKTLKKLSKNFKKQKDTSEDLYVSQCRQVPQTLILLKLNWKFGFALSCG